MEDPGLYYNGCCYNCATDLQRMSWFIVCPTCGNKRCPKGTDHKLECTDSNETNQTGSRYDFREKGEG